MAQDPTPPQLSLEVTEHGPHAVLARVRGELDLASAWSIPSALAEHAEKPHAVVDLADVTFMDSSGVHALLEEHRRRQERGHALIVAGVHGRLLELLRLVGVDTELRIAPDAESALDGHRFD